MVKTKKKITANTKEPPYSEDEFKIGTTKFGNDNYLYKLTNISPKIKKWIKIDIRHNLCVHGKTPSEIKKYCERPGPPYHAKDFLYHEKMYGNDGNLYTIPSDDIDKKKWVLYKDIIDLSLYGKTTSIREKYKQRNSPPFSASSIEEDYQLKGNDNNIYINKKNCKGVLQWKKININKIRKEYANKINTQHFYNTFKNRILLMNKTDPSKNEYIFAETIGTDGWIQYDPPAETVHKRFYNLKKIWNESNDKEFPFELRTSLCNEGWNFEKSGLNICIKQKFCQLSHWDYVTLGRDDEITGGHRGDDDEQKAVKINEEEEKKRYYLYGCNLEFADLRGADLENANLQGVNLKGSNLSNTTLSDASFENADLRMCNFNNAWAKYTKFSNSNRNYATFNGAYIAYAYMN